MRKRILKLLDHTIIILYDEHFHNKRTIDTILRNEAQKVIKNTKQESIGF